MLQAAEAVYGLHAEEREDEGANPGVGALGLWLVLGTVAGLGLLAVALGVVAQRLPPGALLGAWLLANGLLVLLTLLSALRPGRPQPPATRRRSPGAR